MARVMARTEFGWPGTSHIPNAPTNEGITVHYDGSNRGLAKKPHEECVKYWKWCREFHMETRGWMDIGYSYGICPGHGRVMTGRGYGKEQAAQGGKGAIKAGGNTRRVSVTLMLGPDEDPTTVQITAFREFRKALMAKGNRGHIDGHSNWVSTSCPGNKIRALIKSGAFSTPISEEERIAAAAESMPVILTEGEAKKLVVKFQRENGLETDGVIGPITWAEILREMEGNG